MLISLRRLRPFTLCSSILLLVACGGGSDGASTSGPSSTQLSQARSAGLQSTLDLATNRVILRWSASVGGASQYLIEQQDSNGAWVALDGVWASLNGVQMEYEVQNTRWVGVVSGVTTLRVEAVLPGGATLPLAVAGSAFDPQPATSITVAAPAQVPSIEVDQPEPLEIPAKVSLTNSGTYQSVEYNVDSLAQFGTSYGSPPYSQTLDPRNYTTGDHLIHATLALNPFSAVIVSRNVRIHTNQAAINLIDTRRTADSFDADLVASSDVGIVSVAGVVDGALLETLTAPNTCVPLPCGAGQPFNAYRLSIDSSHLSVRYHPFTAMAIDSAGSTATDLSDIIVNSWSSATLDSPADGAVVSGTLHVSGIFSSKTPGALEVMVTLSGAPVYDTTVANTGASIPYAADISLAGVAPGYHTLGTYARVGNTTYTQTASVLIQVATSP